MSKFKNITEKWKEEELLDLFQELKEKLQVRFLAQEQSEKEPQYISLNQYIPEAIEILKNKNTIHGIATGYKDLDAILGGISPGELSVIFGKTGMGKTMFALNLLMNAYIETKQTFNTLIVTMEMTKPEVTARIKEVVDDSQYNQELEAIGNFIYYYHHEVAEPTVNQLRFLIEKMKKEVGCEVVLIDHLHCFSRSFENQANEIGVIVRALKKIALDLNVAIMLISHVRKIEGKRRLELDDLRGSSFIAQDADMAISINQEEDRPYVLEVDVQKNRNKGRKGGMLLAIDKNSHRLKEINRGF